ncbi:MAG: hypothetical protein PVH53_06720 [Desulfobacterales bacterium]|jgi:hypothetical protein
MTSLLKLGCGCALIMLVFMFQAAPVSGAETLTEIQVPEGLSPELTYLLDLADPAQRQSFQPAKIKKLLEYVQKPKDSDALYYADSKLGSPSAYLDFDIRQEFDYILKYSFNPNVPGHLMAPSSTRLSHWNQVQGSDGQLPELWDTIDDLQTPVVVRGIETIENTPDVFSGAYYRYQLNRALILFKDNNRKVLISISRQTGTSEVGKKGYVLGSDDNWDYFYSGKPGLTIPGLSWVKSRMYDSYGVNIYLEMDPAAPLLRCGVFRWIQAGWSKINVVKRHHIHNGIKRFAKSFRQIMEHPALPDIDTLGKAFSKIKALSEDELRASIQTYLTILENQYGRDYRPPRRWSPQVFKDKKPWLQMSTEAMQSVLMVEFLKHAMGKRDAQDVVAFWAKSN